ncbi:MAG TPA: A/G-specific adenine glycosylase [Chloroflexota bacterium]|nr:A/G-specific adenine glycosylase [Chloroflexota bacterium]
MEPRIAALQEAIIGWYRANGRDLPWRRTRDPYAILVSELMLQQQTVRHVTPVYLRFLERFPDLASLAAASRAEVIRIWQPLGRYASAVRLHAIARHLMHERGGDVPRTVEALLELGGIGPYTAGAVACFAFEQPAPLVDTNVRRVLRRLFGAQLPAGAAGDRTIWRLAEELLPAAGAYEWNQGLIDLGAAVCVARTPRCSACPVTAWCDFAAPATAATADSLAPDPPPSPYAGAAPASNGAGGGARTIAETRAPYGASPAPRPPIRYEGSRRWYRGQIMQALCHLPPGEALPLEDLGRRLALDATPEGRALLDDLLAALARDGLLCLESRSGGAVWLTLPD